MKKSQNSFISLAKGFQSVKLKSHNTASAIFPIMISKKNDLIIVFFNYWLNKNKINPNHIKFFARLYDQDGRMAAHFEKNISNFHNQISLKDMLKSIFSEIFEKNALFVRDKTRSKNYKIFTKMYGSK